MGGRVLIALVGVAAVAVGVTACGQQGGSGTGAASASPGSLGQRLASAQASERSAAAAQSGGASAAPGGGAPGTPGTGALADWTFGSLGGSGGYMSVSCPTAAFCMAAGSGGDVYTFDGSAWTGPRDADPGADNGQSLQQDIGVSCASASFCVLVDDAGNALTWNGSTWSAADALGGVGGPGGLAVSCASAGFCLAIDSGGGTYVWKGSGWTTGQPLPPDTAAEQDPGSLADPFYQVSCPSTSFCVAAGADGTFATFNGTSWTTPVSVDSTVTGGTGEGVTISCVSDTFCSAVDSNGNAYTFTGSAWKPAGLVTNGDRGTISCPSAGDCLAVDDYGYPATLSGDSWTEGPRTPLPIMISVGGNPALPAAVSCASASLCVAVANDRYGIWHS